VLLGGGYSTLITGLTALACRVPLVANLLTYFLVFLSKIQFPVVIKSCGQPTKKALQSAGITVTLDTLRTELADFRTKAPPSPLAKLSFGFIRNIFGKLLHLI
jgi:hypothetical protein